MNVTDELEFKAQILARCLGSALGLGSPLRVGIHFAQTAPAPTPTIRTKVRSPLLFTVPPVLAG
ncbi:MAG: hypothetical protein NW237_10745 [Cyanobacteriota bacterium]|nr:hypothetical protein [Cyanobacteriota bacterium]